MANNLLPKLESLKPNKIVLDVDYEGHRQRMMTKLLEKGPQSMTELELLEMILMRALPRRDVKPLAKALLRHFISLKNIIKAETWQLSEFPCVKKSVISLFKLIDGVSLQMVTPSQRKGPILSEWPEVLDFCRLNLSHIMEEHLYIIFLDDKYRIILHEDFQRGTKTRIQIYPIEIMKRALNLSANSIILIHNHPSGEARPSREDLNQTADLESFLNTVGIKILDHLIIGDNQIYSINSKGIINEQKSATFVRKKIK